MSSRNTTMNQTTPATTDAARPPGAAGVLDELGQNGSDR
jgi:hypothetical protein